MKKPTLEEVKEHFKDAKVVECLFLRADKINVTEIKEDETYGCYYTGNTENPRGYACLWHKNHEGFARIVEYKEVEPIKPKHYEVSITNRKTKESINCDYIDIAKGLGLSNEQFLALRYFRKKGNLDKQINDTKKGIESYKAHLENLELLKLKNG